MAFDQRGRKRKSGIAPDIGAVENGPDSIFADGVGAAALLLPCGRLLRRQVLHLLISKPSMTGVYRGNRSSVAAHAWSS